MKLRHLFAVGLCGILSVTAARAASVSITIAPPPLVAYEQPLCPTEGYLWTPGYWDYDYDAGEYYWVNGVWVAPPRVGFLWTPGYWGFADGFYAFHRGYWGPTIGFYGGINYGYGYGGYGYDGGRWEGRTFRYNTAITRVNVTNIHNTYVDRDAVRRTTDSRVAFNGRGGIEARPDAAQRSAASASHARPTAEQAKAVQQARLARHTDPGATRTDRRSATAGSTPTGRTNNAARNPRLDRANPTTASNAPGVEPSGRDRAVRQNRAGRERTNLTRGSGRNAPVDSGRGRSRAPQVARQAKAPQPRGGGRPKGEDKRQ